MISGSYLGRECRDCFSLPAPSRLPAKCQMLSCPASSQTKNPHYAGILFGMGDTGIKPVISFMSRQAPRGAPARCVVLPTSPSDAYMPILRTSLSRKDILPTSTASLPMTDWPKDAPNATIMNHCPT